jgi:hypothetical protein
VDPFPNLAQTAAPLADFWWYYNNTEETALTEMRGGDGGCEVFQLVTEPQARCVIMVQIGGPYNLVCANRNEMNKFADDD